MEAVGRGTFSSWGDQTETDKVIHRNQVAIWSHLPDTTRLGPLSVSDPQLKGFVHQTSDLLCLGALSYTKLSFPPVMGPHPVPSTDTTLAAPMVTVAFILFFCWNSFPCCSQVKMLDGEDEYYKSLSPVDSIPEEDNSGHTFFFPSSSKGASFAQHWAVLLVPRVCWG